MGMIAANVLDVHIKDTHVIVEALLHGTFHRALTPAEVVDALRAPTMVPVVVGSHLHTHMGANAIGDHSSLHPHGKRMSWDMGRLSLL